MFLAIRFPYYLLVIRMVRYEEQSDKSVLVKGHFTKYLNDIEFKRKARGINLSFYTPDGSKPSDKDAQTIINFCSNMINPNPKDQKGKEDIDKLIGEALDKVLLSDNVKSAQDFYHGKSRVEKFPIETNLNNLEDTALDSYIHRATNITETKKGIRFGRIY